jgi:hypothetical protein
MTCRDYSERGSRIADRGSEEIGLRRERSVGSQNELDRARSIDAQRPAAPT